MRCFGPSCTPDAQHLPLGGLYQEWPTYIQIALPAKLVRFCPHVVHSTSHLGPLLAPGRLVVTVHDLIFRRFPADYAALWLAITRALFPLVLRRASAVIADSRATRRDLVRFYGVGPEKIKVVYPGVDDRCRAPVAAARIEQARHKYDLGPSRYALCLGPWVRRKNLGVVIAAFGLLAARLPDLMLVITGRPTTGMRSGDVGQALASLSEEARSRVRTVGHVTSEELQALLAGASALAYPSRVEGFGLPPLEAMAAGVPAVVSSAEAVVEATGGAAIVVRSSDARGWAAALESVISDPDVAARLVAAGRDWSARFTWEECALQALAVYREVASRHV